MVGGAMLTKEFIRSDLANKLILTIIPIILGEGLPFFDSIGEQHSLYLEDVVAFKDGIVELSYETVKV